MKIAVRFPVKPSLIIYRIIVGIHLLFLLLVVFLFNFGWQSLIGLVTIVISYFFSIRHYQSMTWSLDDLCWNGDSWLMQFDCEKPNHKRLNHQIKAVNYLTLKSNSWLSSFACLLRFSSGKKHHVWLFTRANLGVRAYSELCYLVKQNLKYQAKTSNH